jgi:hypothetical protein
MTLNVMEPELVLILDGAKVQTLVKKSTKFLISLVNLMILILNLCTAKVVILNGLNIMNLTAIVIMLVNFLS